MRFVWLLLTSQNVSPIGQFIQSHLPLGLTHFHMYGMKLGTRQHSRQMYVICINTLEDPGGFRRFDPPLEKLCKGVQPKVQNYFLIVVLNLQEMHLRLTGNALYFYQNKN